MTQNVSYYRNIIIEFHINTLRYNIKEPLIKEKIRFRVYNSFHEYV